MYCPDEKMKINKFVVVAIPRNCEYMKRFGATTMPSNAYTGDEVAPMPANKVDLLAQAERYAKLQDELAKGNE